MTDLVFNDDTKLKMNWGELGKTINVYAFGRMKKKINKNR